MRRERRAILLLALACCLRPSPLRSQSLDVLEVPFIAQSELLCGGAAAAMVMRYWGERGVDAESFQSLVDRKARGIRTTALATNLRSRHWSALEVPGSAESLTRELQQGRPVISLIEDHPGAYHYVVVVARNTDGVVFHDPARAPFRVASTTDFDRRWSATGRWMLVVTPLVPSEVEGPAPRRPTEDEPASPIASPATCDQQIAEGVRQAERSDLDSAERTLVSALSCPGAAAVR